MTPTPPSPDSSPYFRKGFGLKAEVQEELAAYEGALVDRMKASDYTLTAGGGTICPAREFGFCYGVGGGGGDAYQTRGEIPHPPDGFVGGVNPKPYRDAR